MLNASGRLPLQIHLTLCSRYLLNDKSFNTCFVTICFDKLCLVGLIYFCQFADFKLQRNKVQSKKFSFAVMENFDTESIASLINEESTIEEDIYFIVWFYRICILIRENWNAVVQNMEYQRGYYEIRLTIWLKRQSKSKF